MLIAARRPLLERDLGEAAKLARMQAFDALLYGFVTTYQGDNYFNGLGQQALGAAELEQINNWAAQIFERLVE